MFCSKCGSSIPDDSVFCPNCGASFASNAAPVNQAPVNPAPAYQQYAPTPTPVYQTSTGAGSPDERAAAKSVLIFGILALAFACSFYLSIVGIVFAFIAFSKARAYERNYGPATGKAKVGKIFSIVSIPVSIVMTIIFVIWLIAVIVAASYTSYYYRYLY